MLNLCILTYVIQTYIKYIILFIDLKKFKVYNEFKHFRNNLNGLSETEPNQQRYKPNPNRNLKISEWDKIFGSENLKLE